MSSLNFAQCPDRSYSARFPRTGEYTPWQPSARARSLARRCSSSRITAPSGSHSGRPAPASGSVAETGASWVVPRRSRLTSSFTGYPLEFGEPWESGSRDHGPGVWLREGWRVLGQQPYAGDVRRRRDRGKLHDLTIAHSRGLPRKSGHGMAEEPAGRPAKSTSFLP